MKEETYPETEASHPGLALPSLGRIPRTIFPFHSSLSSQNTPPLSPTLEPSNCGTPTDTVFGTQIYEHGSSRSSHKHTAFGPDRGEKTDQQKRSRFRLLCHILREVLGSYGGLWTFQMAASRQVHK